MVYKLKIEDKLTMTLSPKDLFLCSALAGLVLLPTLDARAGFEWVPVQETQPSPAPIPQAVEAAPLAPMMITPEPKPMPENKQVAPMSMPQPEVQTENAPLPLIKHNVEPATIFAEKQAQRMSMPVTEEMQPALMEIEPALEESPMDQVKTQALANMKHDIDTLLKKDPAPMMQEKPQALTATPFDSEEVFIDVKPRAREPERITFSPQPPRKEKPVVKVEKEKLFKPFGTLIKNTTQPKVMPLAPAAEPIQENVLGFGKEIPLAIALDQILPAGTAYSFGSGVNPGQAVSWDGGKPWNQLVREMILPAGLDMRQDGNIVHIYRPDVKKNFPVAPEFTAVEKKPAPEKITAPPVIKPAKTEKKVAEKSQPDIRRRNILDPGPIPEQEDVTTAFSALTQDKEEQSLPEIEPAAREIVKKTAKPVIEPPGPLIKKWEAQQGQNLQDVLESWATAADADLIWKAGQEYKISSYMLVDDDFQNAVSLLVNQGLENNKRPGAKLVNVIKHNETRKTLVITDKSYKD